MWGFHGSDEEESFVMCRYIATFGEDSVLFIFPTYFNPIPAAHIHYINLMKVPFKVLVEVKEGVESTILL
jgi:hypothetical protein